MMDIINDIIELDKNIGIEKEKILSEFEKIEISLMNSPWIPTNRLSLDPEMDDIACETCLIYGKRPRQMSGFYWLHPGLGTIDLRDLDLKRLIQCYNNLETILVNIRKSMQNEYKEKA